MMTEAYIIIIKTNNNNNNNNNNNILFFFTWFSFDFVTHLKIRYIPGILKTCDYTRD